MLLDLIKNRKSVRDYLDKDIPTEILDKILQAGYLAPSWMNSQSWKFILVKNPVTKEILSELAGFQPHVKNAPAVIVCIADKNAWNKEEFSKVLAKRGMKEEGIEKILSKPMFYPPLLGNDKVLLRSLEGVTYASAYMMLEAKDQGVDSCIIGAISNEATILKPEIVKKAKETLNLKEGQVLITMITLGYAKDPTPAVKVRKDYSEVIFYEKIEEPNKNN